MKQHPNAHFLMIGNDDVSYGKTLPNGKTYKQKMLEELDLDQARLHWLGKLPYDQYCEILKYSMAHIYMTVPFVLSWSIIEAMSLGCPIVASRTSPVMEVIKNKKNGLLADFFDENQIAEQISTLLKNPSLRKQYSMRARETVLKHYSINKILPQYEKLITHIANKEFELLEKNLQRKTI